MPLIIFLNPKSVYESTLLIDIRKIAGRMRSFTDKCQSKLRDNEGNIPRKNDYRALKMIEI